MQRFTVKQLAEIAGVSVRTLHHYDKIGLLCPGKRSESRYRYYGEEECLRLQQILLYRELELPLAAIRELLDDPDFDALTALQEHKRALTERKTRLNTLLRTVEDTILALTAKQTVMDYTTLYTGFSKETAEAYRKEAEERWGKDVIEASHQRLLALGKKEWEALQALGEDLNKQLAACVHLPVDCDDVQRLIALHYSYIGKHFDVTREIYRNLGVMYAKDERFRSYYDRYDERMADFLRDAIAFYCGN